MMAGMGTWSGRGGRSRRLALLVAVLISPSRPGAILAGEVGPAGERLAAVLEAMDVEHRWLAGRPVHWRTGTVDHRGRNGATHCSAFVAAACDRLGVYILRPPQHPQTLLANAQNAWLRAQGPRYGWRPVESPEEAQRLANLGQLVVASYRNPDRRRPGHIAIVRPDPKGPARIAEEGPQLIQAGRNNYRSVPLREGFRHHRRAWEDGEIAFFVHPLPTASRASVPRAGSFTSLGNAQ